MAAFDVTAAAGILKTIYKGPIRNNINMGTPLSAIIEKREDMVSGGRVEVPVQVQRNEGVGARSMQGSVPLPEAVPDVVDKVYENTVLLLGQIEVTLPAILKTRTGEGAYDPAVERQSKTMTASLREDFERMISDNDELGRGILGVCGTTTGSTTVNLTGGDITSRQSIRKNMRIDIVDFSNDSVLAANRTITAVNLTNGIVTSIVISGAVVTTSSTHRIVRTGNWKNEVIGLPGIIDSAGTLHSLSPATYDGWSATEIAVGGAISEDILQQLFGEVDIASGMNASGNPDYFLLMHNIQYRKIYGLLDDRIRYNVTTTPGLNGGFQTLSYNGAPIVQSRFWNPAEIALVHKPSLSLQSESDWDWMDEDGAMLARKAGFAHYEATLYRATQLVTENRAAHGKLTGLTL